MTREDDIEDMVLNVSDPSNKDKPSAMQKHYKGIEESHNKIATDDSLALALIEVLKYLSTLVVLDAYGNRMSRETFTELGHTILEHLKELKLLRLDGVKITHEVRNNTGDDHIMELVEQLKNHLSFQMLYVTRACRCVDSETCSTECKIAFWSKLDDIIGGVPVKVKVEMK